MKITETDVGVLVVKGYTISPQRIKYLNSLSTVPEKGDVNGVWMIMPPAFEEIARIWAREVGINKKSLAETELARVGHNVLIDIINENRIQEIHDIRVRLHLASTEDKTLDTRDTGENLVSAGEYHRAKVRIEKGFNAEIGQLHERLGISVQSLLFLEAVLGFLEQKDRIKIPGTNKGIPAPTIKKYKRLAEEGVNSFKDKAIRYLKNIADHVEKMQYNMDLNEVLEIKSLCHEFGISLDLNIRRLVGRDQIAGEDLYSLLLMKYHTEYKATRELQKAAEKQMRREGRISEEVKSVRIRPTYIKNDMVFDIDIACESLGIEIPDGCTITRIIPRETRWKGRVFLKITLVPVVSTVNLKKYIK